MEEKEQDPEIWRYRLERGPHDGASGRFVRPRRQIHRPSHVDSRRVDVYELEFTDGTDREAIYRYLGEMWAVLAAEQDV